MECWAATLGTCGGGPSREHYITDGIFEGETINAFGLPWCIDEPLSIGLAAATARILCKRHNEALSDLDNEASKLSKFITLNVFAQPLVDDTTTLDGRLIEKWALKTLFNLGYLGALDRPTFARLLPPADIIGCLFSDATVPEGAGLYLLSGGMTNEDYKTGLAWGPIRNHETRKVLGMTFTFNGVRFVVSMLPVRAEDRIRANGVVDGFDYGATNITYRPRNIILGSSSAGKKTINLSW
jgi:hypothetical protein